ncbi:hypothetical protein [Adhaeribacter terreus]|uniref:Uncharacterized protein n=1 Tax=Adhaeribacter terreus TaxID=529703 RepID=A0ABW0EFB9_9BACT
MNVQKNFYEFNLSSLQERLERNNLFPELAKFHIALREELTEEEYQAFYNSEKADFYQLALQNQTFQQTCIEA